MGSARFGIQSQRKSELDRVVEKIGCVAGFTNLTVDSDEPGLYRLPKRHRVRTRGTSFDVPLDFCDRSLKWAQPGREFQCLLQPLKIKDCAPDGEQRQIHGGQRRL